MTLWGSGPRVGVEFGPQGAVFMAVRPGKGQGELVAVQRAACPLAELDQAPAQGEFKLAAGEFLARVGLKNPPVLVCLPTGQALVHHFRRPAKAGRAQLAAQVPPLEQLTPLDEDQVYWDFRAAAGPAGLGQVVVLPRSVVDPVLELCASVGFKVRALDLAACGFALAASQLCDQRPALALSVAPQGVEWAVLHEEGIGPLGHLSPLEGEEVEALAQRASQHAVQVDGLRGAREVLITGSAAEGLAAWEQEPAPGDGGEPSPRVRVGPGQGLLPPGLTSADLSLFGLLSGARRQGLFNLLPLDLRAPWLERPGTTRRLALAAGILILAVVGPQVGMTWYAQHQASSRLEQAQTELSALRARQSALNKLGPKLAPLQKAQKSQAEAASLLSQVAALLPSTVWLERWEYGEKGLTLYLNGANAKQLTAALARLPAWELNGSVAKSKTPGAGKPAFRAQLTRVAEGAAKPVKAKGNGKAKSKSKPRRPPIPPQRAQPAPPQ